MWKNVVLRRMIGCRIDRAAQVSSPRRFLFDIHDVRPDPLDHRDEGLSVRTFEAAKCDGAVLCQQGFEEIAVSLDPQTESGIRISRQNRSRCDDRLRSHDFYAVLTRENPGIATRE